MPFANTEQYNFWISAQILQSQLTTDIFWSRYLSPTEIVKKKYEHSCSLTLKLSPHPFLDALN